VSRNPILKNSLSLDGDRERDTGRSKPSNFDSTDTLPKIEAKLATACKDLGIDYAPVNFSAAGRLAPAIRYQWAMIYVLIAPVRLQGESGLHRLPAVRT
jgi:hypothetical protein